MNIAILSALFLFTACRKEVNSWRDLNENERAYLREQDREKCLADSGKNFNLYKNLSNSSIANLSVKNRWKIETKINSGSSETIIRTSYLTVWKKSSQATYLLWKDNSGSSPVHKFVKIVHSINNEMISDLMWKKCSDKSNYLIVDSSSNLKLSTSNGTYRHDENTRYQDDFVYTHDFNQLAILGSFNERRTRKTIDNNGAVKNTSVETTVATNIADDTNLLSSYKDYDAAQFCTNKWSSVTKSGNPNKKEFKYPFNTTGLICTSDISGPDADGDSVTDFDPATEL